MDKDKHKRLSNITRRNILFSLYCCSTFQSQDDLWDRPVNLQEGGYGFFFVQKLFFGQHESYNIFFLSQNLTLGYITKTLNQIIFFSSTKIRILFSATLGIKIFFQKKMDTNFVAYLFLSLSCFIRRKWWFVHQAYHWTL